MLLWFHDFSVTFHIVNRGRNKKNVKRRVAKLEDPSRTRKLQNVFRKYKRAVQPTVKKFNVISSNLVPYGDPSSRQLPSSSSQSSNLLNSVPVLNSQLSEISSDVDAINDVLFYYEKSVDHRQLNRIPPWTLNCLTITPHIYGNSPFFWFYKQCVACCCYFLTSFRRYYLQFNLLSKH